MNHLAMLDRITGLTGDLPESATAKVHTLKLKMADGIRWRFFMPMMTMSTEVPKSAQESCGKSGVRPIPPVQPDIGDEAASNPVIRDIKHRRDAKPLKCQSE
jgi:hypothetical protein